MCVFSCLCRCSSTRRLHHRTIYRVSIGLAALNSQANIATVVVLVHYYYNDTTIQPTPKLPLLYQSLLLSGTAPTELA